MIDNVVHNLDEQSKFLDYPQIWWKSGVLDLEADEGM